MINIIHKFFIIPFTEKKLFVIGILLKFKYQLITTFLPLRHYRSLFYMPQKADETCLINPSILAKIKRTIRRINKFLPFGDTCIMNVLIASRLLRLYGIHSRIEFELLKEKNCFIEAHAYLTFNNKPVYLFDRTRKHYNVKFY